MEKLWLEKSKNGTMPSFQIAVLLGQIRKNFEVDEEALDEMVTELDKGEFWYFEVRNTIFQWVNYRNGILKTDIFSISVFYLTLRNQ